MFEYRVVRAGESSIQEALDAYSKQNWRLVQTVTSMGYTVALIMERETLPEA